MKNIKNIIFDMGRVLLQFEPYVSLNKYCDKEEDKELIYKELFQGPEWIMGDEGKITNGQRYELVKERIPERGLGIVLPKNTITDNTTFW